jgi:hypothetical protein
VRFTRSSRLDKAPLGLLVPRYSTWSLGVSEGRRRESGRNCGYMAVRGDGTWTLPYRQAVKECRLSLIHAGQGLQGFSVEEM